MLLQSGAGKFLLERFKGGFAPAAEFRYAFDDVAELRSFFSARASVLTLGAASGSLATRAAAPYLVRSFVRRLSFERVKLHVIYSERSRTICASF